VLRRAVRRPGRAVATAADNLPMPQLCVKFRACLFVLLIWIEIEIKLCSYLLTFIFIEFFANVTILTFRHYYVVCRHQFVLTSYNSTGA